MEQDQIGLNPQHVQCQNLLIQPVPEGLHRLGNIPAFILTPPEGKKLRLILAVNHVLGKHTHAQLVEGSQLQRLQRFALYFFRLMVPGVAGGAEGLEGRAVSINKRHIPRLNRAMVAFLCRKAFQLAGFTPVPGAQGVAPDSRAHRHPAEQMALSRGKAGHSFHLPSHLKRGGSAGWRLHFPHPVLLDLLHLSFLPIHPEN